LESLTDDFNDAFGYIISVVFLSVSVTVLISLFQTVLYFLTSTIGIGLGHLLPLALNVWILIEICETSNEFEMQVGTNSNKYSFFCYRMLWIMLQILIL